MKPQTDRVHDWFGLSYCAYLALPRSILQSMPDEWQERFVKCLDELDAVHPDDSISTYKVLAQGERGRFVTDPYRDYDRGRRKVKLRGID